MNVPIAVDLESGAPIYTQLVEQIKEGVFSGALRPGQQLPTVRQLAADLRINFNTVARAYAILDQEGVISTQQGRGTFITQRLTAEDLRQMRAERLRAMAAQFVAAAERQGYDPTEVQVAVAAAYRGRPPARQTKDE
ncbi:MAG: GntR family transcriptional regulator [Chloroflexi bacterium]|nr:GntR family transcriptional regulator [Chloroflexota bacterium]